MCKIKNLKKPDMYPVLERMDLIHYNELCTRFLKTYGTRLPEFHNFSRIGLNKNELHVLHNDYEVYFCYEGVNYSFEFKKGFIYDKLSVPRAFRSFVDNDFHLGSIAGLVHDACFALHLLGGDEKAFDKANDMFFELIKKAMQIHLEYMEKSNYSIRAIRKFKRQMRIKPKLYLLGVSSKRGWKIYNSKDPKTHWLNGFVKLRSL